MCKKLVSCGNCPSNQWMKCNEETRKVHLKEIDRLNGEAFKQAHSLPKVV
jgi:hypothetical protein